MLLFTFGYKMSFGGCKWPGDTEVTPFLYFPNDVFDGFGNDFVVFCCVKDTVLGSFVDKSEGFKRRMSRPVERSMEMGKTASNAT